MKKWINILIALAFFWLLVLVVPRHSAEGHSSATTLKQLTSTPPPMPDFVLPYPLTDTVHWSGGPHQYGVTDTLTTIPAGRGSGLDFASGSNPHFQVLAMASGTVIEATCNGYGSLGCIVAIRHDVGGTVLIYAHLERSSIQAISERLARANEAGVSLWVPQGTVLGKAGATWGQDSFHLHIELRDGSESCSIDCLEGGLGGNPLGWGDLLPFVDGYLIGSYLFDSEGTRVYNYDGSAVREDVIVSYNFRYFDYPGNVPRENVVARVGASFECDPSAETCEDNSQTSLTQFAGHGNLGSSDQGESKYSIPANQNPAGGILLSTNLPVPILFPPLPMSDSATFVMDVTLPDGTVVSPGQALNKVWRVRNTGSTTWGSGYELVFVGGEQMGAPNAVNVPVTTPDQTADLSVNITAPTEGGTYVGRWRLRNPQGTYFGDMIYVQITVPGDSDPPPENAIELTCLNCPASVLPGETFRPAIRAQVNSGQLLETRGDMLRNTDGNLYGAWPHVAAERVVNPGETHDFVFYTDNPITAPDNEGTYVSRWRVWRNGNWAGEEFTIEFQVSASGGNNYPPNPPSLVSPGDWAVFDGEIPTLQAQHNGDPDGDEVTHYYFEIFESHDTPNSGWITENTWTPPGLGTFGYQWHVKVRDSQGAESDWSETRHFNIEDPEPQIYEFRWEWCHEPWGSPEQICFCAQTNAGTLRLQVNRATDGSGDGEWQILNELGSSNYNCNDDNDRPPTWTQLEYEAGTHLVRLYARKDGGWEAAATADLLVTLPSDRRPNNPFGQLPLNNSYVSSQTVHFDWIDTLRTTDYHLEASNDPSYTTLLIDEHFSADTSQYNWSFDNDYEDIYWRVTSTGPFGTHTGGQSFHIDVDSPTSSVAALPPVTTDDKFTVSWSGSDTRSGLRWYHVQVREDNRPESEWTDWLVNTTKTAELFQAQPGHTYYFRVRAMDDVGNWEDWPTNENGDTYTHIDPPAAPPSDWWDEGYGWKRNLIVLNNDGDTMPVHFPIHIHFDNGTDPTAAEIYNASLASIKGDDVRIVYNNGVELDRFIQRFTSSEIDIWFPLQIALSGGQTNNSSYQMYYSNAGASNPPADVNAVFLPEVDGNTMGLWHFQEGSGSTVSDSSGHSHHGSFTSPGWADGLLGNTGTFNGSDAYVNIGDHGDFDLTAMTLEAWIYVTSSNYGHIISKWGTGGNAYFIRMLGGRRVQFQISGDGGNRDVVSGETLELNRWYHVAGVHDGGNNMWIYINGVQRGHNGDSRTPFSTSSSFRIGRDPAWGDSAFPGRIQHVRASNIVRTSFPYARIDVLPSVAAGLPVAPPVSGSPDLVIRDLTPFANPGGGLLVQAVFQNQGEKSTQNNFYTDLYVDHLPGGEGDYTGSIRFWINAPIEAGATVSLTTVLNDLTGAGEIAGAPGSEITGTLYAQVDSTGVVSETDNSNNIYADGIYVCVATPDAYESDDLFSNASPIRLGETQRHNIGGPEDQDWVSFEAQAGITYTVRTLNLDDSADTHVYLYDTDGTTLLTANDDYDDSLASRLDWAAPADGTYYLLIKHWNPNIGGCGTGYSVRITSSTIYLPLILREF